MGWNQMEWNEMKMRWNELKCNDMRNKTRMQGDETKLT